MKIITLSIDMRRKNRMMLMLFLASALLLVGFVSVAAAKGVSTDLSSAAEVQAGTYSLITNGCMATDDPSTVAILHKEGAPYNIGFARGTDYQVISGLSAGEALRQAEAIVECSASVQDTEVAEISAPDGTLLGYEVSPTFMPLRYGSYHPVDTSYKIKGNEVVASVVLDPFVTMSDQGGG
jgi:hypothetical protein